MTTTGFALRAIGIDLAWGDRARTGLAEVGADGRLLRSCVVRTDDEIAHFLHPGHEPGLSVAIDAPLIVSNPTGMRACERAVAQQFGRYGASAHPANLGNPLFAPQSRALRLARRFGWSTDPTARASATVSVAIEVYPHPAMVSLFDLPRIIPYKAKRGRTVADRAVAFEVLCSAIERHLGARLRLTEHPRWAHLRLAVATASRHVDFERVEDEIDAIVCAHLAWTWATNPDELMVLGNAEDGFIVTPPAPPRP